jgi:hypothetical protein
MRAFSVAMFLLVGLTDVVFAQNCRELQRTCEMKDALGERGQGHCRRFREACQRPSFDRPSFERVSTGQVCAKLRAHCLYKDELGERGQGNCRRYREMCRGGL